jgi:tRNA A-37 threonylcarbamoyl transferase component Bud32
MDRLAQLVEQFQALAQRIPSENDPSQPWQDEVVEAVSECFDVKTEGLTALVKPVVPVAKVAAFKGALRKLNERVGRYTSANNPEIATAFGDVNAILAGIRPITPQAGTSLTTTSWPQGRRGAWTVVTSLGSGGQGLTAKVQRSAPAETGAMKVLKEKEWPSPTARDKAVARFRREIEVTRRLSHPFVLRVLDADVDAPEPWVVTEFMPFGTLQEHCPAYRGDVWRCLRVIRDVALALDELHERGLVHRDVKPSNILLRDLDHPVLGDFGIIHDPASTDLTSTNEVVGARSYMPPEAEHGRLDEPPPSFDVYSLGKVVWTMLSGGARPFIREGFRDRGFDLVELLGRTELESVNRVLDRMIVSDPAKRLGRMTDVIVQIDRVLAEMFGAGEPSLCRVCRSGHYEKKGHFRPSNSGPVLADHEVCPVCGDLRLFNAQSREAWEKGRRG